MRRLASWSQAQLIRFGETVVAFKLPIVIGLAGGLGALLAQTTFNTVVVTNQGQFVNARLSDNVYIDMTTSPPVLRAHRPQRNLIMAKEVDGSWLIPISATFTPGCQVAIVLNGLDATPGVDYDVDTVNARRVIPKYPWVSKDGTLWLVKAHIIP